MPRLGVLGWPVAHSRSPAIQRAALDAAGLEGWSYQLLPVPPEAFDDTVRALPGSGFAGANVTIPHKEAALRLADEAEPSAAAIGAANTLTFRDGTIHAANTDAPALIAALPLEARGLHALVLGAGGTARAAVWALLDAGAAEVSIWNRTPQRAAELAAELGARAVAEAVPADLLVNATSIGMDGNEPPFKALPLDADSAGGYRCVVDFVYRSPQTELLAAARSRGSLVVDGVELLVRQGALSFERWTGRSASLDAMRAAARASDAV